MSLNKGILKVLMREMADITLPECRDVCRPNLNCCAPKYCNIAKHYARREWGITLPETGHPTLPFMGATGCVVEPHLRPLCTVHTCAVQSIGWKNDDPDWNEAYFQLRDRIEDLRDAISAEAGGNV